ncbi:MAG: response regulator [Acidipila sp.]|nr:response regulator [Acidipila sp.]
MGSLDPKNTTTADKGPLIVTVDDDSISLRIIRSTLEKKGYVVKTATSGEEALMMLREMVPDILILDVMMEGMSGYDVCHIAKTDKRLQDVPVIFLTGKDSPTDFKTGQELGAIFYLTKPVRPDRLLQVVRMLRPSSIG